LKIEVHPRSSLLILSAENDAEMDQLARISHELVGCEPIKFKVGIGRQWNTRSIELPLMVEASNCKLTHA
jgi:hypothetical protein